MAEERYFSQDHVNLVRTLQEHDVDFLVLGGVAVAYYGHPRFTKDVDFLVRPERENIVRLFRALDDFFEGTKPDLGSYDDFLDEDQPGVIRFGGKQNRTEILSGADGITYEEARENSEELIVQSGPKVTVDVIGLRALIQNKIESGKKEGREYDHPDAVKLLRSHPNLQDDFQDFLEGR